MALFTAIGLAALLIGDLNVPMAPGSGLLRSLPSSASSKPDSGKVVGFLGQTKVKVAIRSEPNTACRVFGMAKPKQFLIVRKTADKSWYQVLLRNEQYGYVAASAVKQLPYEVTKDGDPETTKPEATVNGWTGHLVARLATAFEGTPYKADGTDPNSGIGNGAFVREAFRAAGIKLPASADHQIQEGKSVGRLEQLKPGDVLFFSRHAEGSDYEGAIFLGGDEYVLSDPKAGEVQLQHLGKSALSHLVAARRYIGN